MNLILPPFFKKSAVLIVFLVSMATAQTETKTKILLQKETINTSSKSDINENLLSFWVGDWEVHWKEEDGKFGKGTNRVKYILDSTAIEEDFKVHSGSMKGFKGKSLSVFREDLKQWKQAWVDNKGGFYDFTGDIQNGSPTFETDIINRKGEEYKFRMVFKDITSTEFTWDWEMSSDLGETWNLKWRIFYKKM